MKRLQCVGRNPRCRTQRCEYSLMCRYFKLRPVSIEKHETTAKAGGEARDRDTLAVGTALVIMGSYRSWPERLTVSSLRTKPAKIMAIEDVREIVFL